MVLPGRFTAVGLALIPTHEQVAPAAVDVLEQVDVSPGSVASLSEKAVGLSRGASETSAGAVAVTTCNRIELYVEHSPAVEPAALVELFRGWAGEGVRPHLYAYTGAQVVRHVLRVAAGLASVVPGENEILGQTRAALATADQLGVAGWGLRRLMQHALRVGKQVRADTRLNAHGASLATKALTLLPSSTPLAGGNAVVVGAGSMAGVVLAALRRAGVARLDVVNRTLSKAQRLAAGGPGEGFSLSALPALVERADVVVMVATGEVPLLPTAMVAGRERPLAIVDLAMPRSVSTAVRDMPQVFLCDLTDVTQAVGDGPHHEAATRAESIVTAGVDTFMHWLANAKVNADIADVRRRAVDMAALERERLARRVGQLPESVWAEIDKTMHRVINKALHEPTVMLRDSFARANSDSISAALPAPPP